jgi:hypothetical protein
MTNTNRRGWLHPGLVVAPSGGLVRKQRCLRLSTKRGDLGPTFSLPRSEQRRRAGGRVYCRNRQDQRRSGLAGRALRHNATRFPLSRRRGALELGTR